MSTLTSRRDRLCNVCQKLDLSSNIAGQNLAILSSERLNCVGTVASCPFCRLVKATWQNEILKWTREWGFFFNQDAPRIAFLNEESAVSPHGSARFVKSTVEPELMKKWLKLCEKEHDALCAPIPSDRILKTPENPSGLKVLRVIDVQDKCVLNAQIGCRYLTLSYLWGQTPTVRLIKGNVADLTANGGLASVWRDLPKTIRDAIDLVALLGERYLWADSLCLIQDDYEDMRDGIQKMDLVYEGAVLTIIAASGSDANAGLPGVHAGSRRVDQYIEEVKPGVKMTKVPTIYWALSGTKYMNRGWTFQELILSRRCLIFLDSRVYFLCRSSIWSEDTIYDNFPLENNSHVGSSQAIPRLLISSSTPYKTYSLMLFRYNSRQLTKDSDALNAMAGILRHISIDLNSETLEGLPTRSFDLSLLFWHQPGPVRRRPEFPSWSWVGWAGYTVAWMPTSEGLEINEWLKMKTYITWYKRESQAGWTLQPVLEYAESGSSRIPDFHKFNPDFSHYRPFHGSIPVPHTELLPMRPSPETLSPQVTVNGHSCSYTLLNFYTYSISIPLTLASISVSFSNSPYDYAVIISSLTPAPSDCNNTYHKETSVGAFYLDDRNCLSSAATAAHRYAVILLARGEMDKCTALDELYSLPTLSALEEPFKTAGGKRKEKGDENKDKDEGFWWAMLISWTGYAFTSGRGRREGEPDKDVAEKKGLGFIRDDFIRGLPPKALVWREILLA